MSKRYFIPINSVNLSNYYRTAIIAPANYTDSRNRDIQTRFHNVILLSDKIFTTESDCALEIVFDKQEEEPNKISDNFYLFDMPLPISRIKNVYFDNEAQKTKTIFNITSGAAFLPNHLIKVDRNANKVNTKELDAYQNGNQNVDWRKYLENYDRVLGGLALMPISKKEYENYPLNYFAILSIFNKQVEFEMKSQQIDTANNYIWAFKSESKYKSLHDMIYNKVDDTVVQDFASKGRIKMQTRNGLYVLDLIDSKSNTYLSAILATYGKDKRKKIDDFVSDFQSSKFESKRLEGIALVFGINNGYTSFRNQYKFGNTKTEIKFKLDCKLDFYTIESIYQFIFNEKTNNLTFPYLDNWCPQYKDNTSSSKNYFTILDKHIFLEQGKKVSVLDIVSSKLSTLFKKWFPLFNTDALKKEIETEIKKDINEYKNNQLKKETEKYLLEIETKNTEISALKNELQELKSISLKTENELKKIIVSEPESKYIKKESETQIGGLFPQNFTPQEKRAEELYSFSLKKIKDIAKNCGIKGLSKYSGKNKQKLINEIVRKEFDQN